MTTAVLPPSVTILDVLCDPALFGRLFRERSWRPWRRDLESFVAREALDAVVVPGRRELPPVSGHDYVAFVDPSGGSADSMTLAVAHRENAAAVLDAVREAPPPFSPEAVVEEFARLLHSYGVTSVMGDRYGGEWPRERFRRHGIYYEVAERTKSELYRELLPLVNSGRVELLDHPRLVTQLGSLERRTTRGGRDGIDHSESERGFAVSFGLQNAENWHKLAELSDRLGGLIEDIEQAKKKT